MKKHYHVLFGLRGCYMPDSNDVFTNKKDAIKHAVWIKRDYNEQTPENKLIGSIKRCGCAVNNGFAVSVDECCEQDCISEERA